MTTSTPRRTAGDRVRRFANRLLAWSTVALLASVVLFFVPVIGLLGPVLFFMALLGLLVGFCLRVAVMRGTDGGGSWGGDAGGGL